MIGGVDEFCGDTGPDTPVYRDSCSPEFEPIGGTWYFRINETGAIAEISVLVLRTEEWKIGERQQTERGGL